MIELNLLMLRLGDNGSQVGTIQILLNGYGYRDEDGDIIDVDNDFGPRTDYAVKAFQRAKGLQADGIVGFNTWSALLK